MIGVAIGEPALDRLVFVEFTHHIVPGGVVGEFIDQGVGLLFAVGVGQGSDSCINLPENMSRVFRLIATAC